MKTRLACAMLLLAGGCRPAEPPLAPLEFAGRTTWNDRCPVRGNRLNPRLDPIWINGRPVGFC
ncbi:MAG TPA: hypothetical protein VJS92_14655 [Candidatus Polarisedimenticolaceae bacterium]|nr:hypothetical protein [Candidatus Polarisedimenticolaceae bacterium]